MKYLISLLMLFSMSAFADPRIDNMASHCQSVMDRGVCKAYNERKQSLSEERKKNPWILGYSLGQVTVGDVYEFRSNPNMCEQLKKDCEADWNSASCRIARSQFRQ